jgi:diphthamide synthase subunit DPH2
MKVIYKITYPNGKIYVGKDSTGDNLRYFGSPNREYLEKDFTPEQQMDITVRKEILFSAEQISESELLKKEAEFIVQYGANNPAKGYSHSFDQTKEQM